MHPFPGKGKPQTGLRVQRLLDYMLNLLKRGPDVRKSILGGLLTAGDDFFSTQETSEETYPGREFRLDEHFRGFVL